jgi:trehalose 6-phosphate phosphatase
VVDSTDAGRRAKAPAATEIREAVPQLWGPLTTGGPVEWLPFECGTELRARGRNKGDAVKAVLSETPVEAAVAYPGGDVADEDALSTVKPRGLAVLVRPELCETTADARIRPPGGLLAFLRRWRDAAGRRP